MARTIRRRKRRHTVKKKFGLQLTSLMDALMIIVVFLLKSYGISAMGVVHTDNLQLPYSTAPETVGEGLVVIVARDKIYIDNEPVLEFQVEVDEEGNVIESDDPKFLLPDSEVGSAMSILPVFDALKKKRDDFEVLASRTDNPEEALKKWTGDIMIQADKKVPYELLRKVMYTAGLVGFKRFRLTVEKLVE